ncbi:MAG: YHS domain protein [Rhodobacteraceae bacterium]|nr:YHS domain protein [Paracoccaceae bacterium]MCY4250522.1 YHS domain protein [Paracoccaceae bacterium]MCY4308116.1 YHS domain protein [Paracoccaceae bacterium]
MFRKFILTFCLMLGLTVTGVYGKQPPIYAEDGVAINGYDPVAYIETISAQEGSNEFTHEWMGAIWKFTSQENLDRFVASPEDYAPQYGGYCAYAVAKGHTATTVPDAFTIHHGKLYLNYSKRVERIWRQNMNNFIVKGDENWPGVLN